MAPTKLPPINVMEINCFFFTTWMVRTSDSASMSVIPFPVKTKNTRIRKDTCQIQHGIRVMHVLY